jgi:hypothetical protein
MSTIAQIYAVCEMVSLAFLLYTIYHLGLSVIILKKFYEVSWQAMVLPLVTMALTLGFHTLRLSS